MEPCYKSTPKDYIYLWSLGVFCMQNKNSKDYKERGIFMLKFLSKVAEKYAKNTNTACFVVFVLHQPKMPASLVKKD